MQDDFLSHFEGTNNYNLLVSGCGMLHSDLIGSIYQKSTKDSELIVIAPIFVSDSEQMLRIHYPSSKEGRLLENLTKVALFSELKPKELTEHINCLDLFTCFFSPLEYPDIEVKS